MEREKPTFDILGRIEKERIGFVLIVVISEVQQFLCVTPFIGFVVGPPTAKETDDKCFALFFPCTYITVAGLGSIACFSGKNSVSHVKKCVGIMYGKGSLSCDLRECIVSGLRKVKESYVYNSIANDQCQIFG